MSQTSLWQGQQSLNPYAELCSALYEREIRQLTLQEQLSTQTIQGRLKSLPYYVTRLANMMDRAETPLDLDSQNATWQAKQSAHVPLSGQDDIWDWYTKEGLELGAIIPVLEDNKIVLDSIERIDIEGKGIRTNAHGWFNANQLVSARGARLLKPTKRVLMSACAGHTWTNNQKATPTIPTLRELLLSCVINWKNFRKPLKLSQ
ncbi:hypothetical protein [Thalassotalea agarivorans]|uniref:Uncharacterized protein n=1 Tax=Thalassotalea agarivorans TaxID=349064 RepID=A0A1H9ZDK5_THASX|nr:hypothetical protein [Thalassotalea agarivorans]SES79657.1 hypothetical protein SAMN05660429_00409 [Thalassotalea agarivorans]